MGFNPHPHTHTPTPSPHHPPLQIYFDLAPRATDYQGTRTLVAAIFMTAAFSAMLNMDASLPTLISSRSSFYRENASLMYNSGAYVLANFFVELPWLASIVLCGTRCVCALVAEKRCVSLLTPAAIRREEALSHATRAPSRAHPRAPTRPLSRMRPLPPSPAHTPASGTS